MAGEEDDAKQRLQRFIHSLDWAALTTLEQLIKTRKKTLKLSRELEASLQEEWDTAIVRRTRCVQLASQL